MCVCLEVDCGVPVSIPHSVVLWSNSSSLGSVALYVCEAGYRTVGEGNVSLCNSDAKWSKVNMRCEGTDNILSSFIYLHVIQNVYDFFISWNATYKLLYTLRSSYIVSVGKSFVFLQWSLFLTLYTGPIEQR